MLKPEQKARIQIDKRLEECGWIVQDFKAMNIYAANGVAVREFPLKKGFVDYMLYADGKAIGVVEAKPDEYTLTGVEIQSREYSENLPENVPHYHKPLPFIYNATGKLTEFTNLLDPEPRSREVFTFHRPEELIRLASLGNDQLRKRLQESPDLITNGLWKAQVQAVTNLEKSFGAGHPRALIQMATGSGKTFTACTFSYRLIKFAKAKRILFLVDRNNLGRQALKEFQQFVSPHTGYKFTEEYNVQHQKKNSIDPVSKVVITTIQRLYSILKGEEEFEEEGEEKSMFESESPLIKEPLPVVYNPKVPPETFDFIVVDECHRSIYNLWRQVIEYFDAFIIGLTATPTPQTVGFFRGNVVQDYSHEKAVVDGVNVGYDVYRIQTKVSQDGATLAKTPGYFVPHRDKRTKERQLKELEDDLTYTANQLDRDVVNESQLRLVIRTFRDKLFTEIFPGRTEVPKTLVFAKTDLHADDIVKIIREEFGKGNDFCQKITSKTTGKKPEDLLNEFRNSYDPRIAVTVDMIATGTDVKALECLLFMRNINSASYFEQMKGRGVRIINPEDLKGVTSDANNKTHFVIVDAVGVCEKDKTPSKPLDRKPSVAFGKLLQMVAQGIVHPDLVSTLGARLARLNKEIDASHDEMISSEADGRPLIDLVSGLFSSIDPDVNEGIAREKFGLKADKEPTQEQVDEVEKERMTEGLKPFHNPKLRDVLVQVKTSLEQVIDEMTQDELMDSGYDEIAKEKARSKLDDFRRFLDENKEEIKALKLLYSTPYRAKLRFKHIKELAKELEKPPLSLPEPQFRLWKLYQETEPDSVRGQGGKNLVDLVTIVQHAFHPDKQLLPWGDSVERNFRNWLQEKEKKGVKFSDEQLKWLTAIKDHIATSLHIEQDDFYEVPFSQMGGIGKVHKLFGDQTSDLLEEMNWRLVA